MFNDTIKMDFNKAEVLNNELVMENNELKEKILN